MTKASLDFDLPKELEELEYAVGAIAVLQAVKQWEARMEELKVSPPDSTFLAAQSLPRTNAEYKTQLMRSMKYGVQSAQTMLKVEILKALETETIRQKILPLKEKYGKNKRK